MSTNLRFFAKSTHLIACATVFCITSIPALRATEAVWRKGKLEEVKIIVAKRYGEQNGDSGPIVTQVQLRQGHNTYFIHCTATYAWSKVGDFKEGGMVTFRLKKDKLLLKDGSGKTFTFDTDRTENSDGKP